MSVRWSALWRYEATAWRSEPWWRWLGPLWVMAIVLATLYGGNFLPRAQADLASLWQWLPGLVLAVAALLAMRGWAQELRSGESERLLVYPQPVWAWVLVRWGWLVWWGWCWLMLAVLPFVGLLAFWGQPDWSTIGLGLGAVAWLWLMVAAIAQVAAATTRQQLWALLMTAVLGALLWLSPLLPAELSLQYFWQMAVDGLWLPGFFAYGLILTPVALGLAVRALRPRPSLRLLALVGVLGVLVLWLLLTVLGRFEAALAIDSTAERRYTLSPVAHQWLAEIPEKITIDFYYTPELAVAVPDYAALVASWRRLLTALERAAPDRVQAQSHAVDPLGDMPRSLIAAGLQPIPFYAGTQQGFAGVVVRRTTGASAALPVVVPARTGLAAYDLLSLVQNLLRDQPPRLGLITGLPLAGDYFSALADGSGGPVPWLIYTQLWDRYRVVPIAPNAKTLPPDLTGLLLIQPPALAPSLRQAVEDFLLQTGRAVIITDPLSEAQIARQLPGQPPPPIADDFADWQRALGIRLDGQSIVADPVLAQRVVLPKAEGGGYVEAIDYSPWWRWDSALVNAALMADAASIVGNLRTINLATAGQIVLLPNALPIVSPLLQTTARGGLLPKKILAPIPQLAELTTQFQTHGAPPIAAVVITGAWQLSPQKIAPQPARIVWIADSDFLDDRFWVQIEQTRQSGQLRSIANNADFLLNAVDFTLGDNRLSALRGRQVTARPLYGWLEYRRAAEAIYTPQLTEAGVRLAALTAARPAADNLDAQRGWQQEWQAAEFAERQAKAALAQAVAGRQNLLQLIIGIVYPLVLMLVLLVGQLWYRRRPPIFGDGDV